MGKDIITLLYELQSRSTLIRKQLHLLLGNSNDGGFHANSFVEDTKNNELQGDVENSEIYNALSQLSPALAKSYLQVKLDIQDVNRSSWAGTAHEIREVLATSLRLLAPEQEVVKQSWYIQEAKTSGPTQKQRVRYILQQYNASSKTLEVVEQTTKLEEMISDLVRSTYSRASDAAHTFKTRREVLRIIKYFDAFAHDLLNLG